MVGICGNYSTDRKRRQMFWDEIRKHMLRAEDNINMETVASSCIHGDEFKGFTEGGNF
jgi:hydroxymethylglutaryl-CoA reductase